MSRSDVSWIQRSLVGCLTRARSVHVEARAAEAVVLVTDKRLVFATRAIASISTSRTRDCGACSSILSGLDPLSW